MTFLIDSCVFFNNLNEATKIIEINEKSKEQVKAISEVIMNELQQPLNASFDATNLDTMISRFIEQKVITLIDTNSKKAYKDNLSNIRKRYYRWMTDPEYLNMLQAKGKLTVDERKSKGFKFKDLGECSLIAIALTDIDNYIIVSNDKGKVYKHPNTNIFKEFPNVKVMTYKEWSEYLDKNK